MRGIRKKGLNALTKDPKGPIRYVRNNPHPSKPASLLVPASAPIRSKRNLNPSLTPVVNHMN
jgi:hypothetical protein